MSLSSRDEMALEHARRVRGLHTWRRAQCKFCEERGKGPDRRGNWCLNAHSGYYHCFRCHVRGFLPGYTALEFEDQPEDHTGIDPPPDFRPLAGRADERLLRPRQYVLSRGISKRTAIGAKLGVSFDKKWQGRIIVPIFAPDDRTWLGWSARLYRPPKSDFEPKYRYPENMPRRSILYNQSALALETDIPLLCVEGVFDALPYYPHVVAFLGKPSPPQVDLLETCARPLLIALDGDAWVEGHWLAKQLEFRGHPRVAALKFPAKQDPSSVPHGWVQERARAIFGSAAEAIGH